MNGIYKPFKRKSVPFKCKAYFSFGSRHMKYGENDADLRLKVKLLHRSLPNECMPIPVWNMVECRCLHHNHQPVKATFSTISVSFHFIIYFSVYSSFNFSFVFLNFPLTDTDVCLKSTIRCLEMILYTFGVDKLLK